MKEMRSDAAKCLKTRNDSFGTTAIQSSEPSEPEGTGNRESSTKSSSLAVNRGFTAEAVKQMMGQSESKNPRPSFIPSHGGMFVPMPWTLIPPYHQKCCLLNFALATIWVTRHTIARLSTLCSFSESLLILCSPLVRCCCFVTALRVPSRCTRFSCSCNVNPEVRRLEQMT